MEGCFGNPFSLKLLHGRHRIQLPLLKEDGLITLVVGNASYSGA